MPDEKKRPKKKKPLGEPLPPFEGEVEITEDDIAEAKARVESESPLLAAFMNATPMEDIVEDEDENAEDQESTN